MKLYVFLIFITIFFFFYVEKYIGNIIIRPDVNGIRILNIFSIFPYMLNPLHNIFLWNIQLLSIQTF